MIKEGNDLQQSKHEEEAFEEGVIEIKDKSLQLSNKALEEAVNQLKINFKATPKDLFSRKSIPSPYIRSENSRPFHFANNGRYLMYFSKTEYIKLDLTNTQIVKRRLLPRADLSPLYYNYNIWSHDSTKVLVLNTRELIEKEHDEPLRKIYVYNTTTGEYTNISEKIFSNFIFKAKKSRGCWVECFNQLDNNQLILNHIKAAKIGPNQIVLYCNHLYSWNYHNNQKRLFDKTSIFDCHNHAFPLNSESLVVVREVQEDLDPTSRRFYTSPDKSELDFYHAKSLKRFLRMDLVDLHHPKLDFSSWSRLPEETRESVLCFSIWSENGPGVCV